jgi:hypothetical protein
MTTGKCTQAQLAKMIKRSEAYVADRLKCLEWSEKLQAGVQENKISFSAARELAKIKDAGTRESYIGHALKTGITPALAAQWREDANNAPVEDFSANGDGGEQIERQPPQVMRFNCAGCNEDHDLTQARMIRYCVSCSTKITAMNKES